MYNFLFVSKMVIFLRDIDHDEKKRNKNLQLYESAFVKLMAFVGQ